MENTFRTIRIRPSWKQFVIDYGLWVILLCLSLAISSTYELKQIPETFLGLFFALIGLATLSLLYEGVRLYCMNYVITEEQLIFEHGVFSRTCDYIELFRIIDYGESQSFMQMFLNIKTSNIYSGDHTSPRFDLIGIDNKLDILGILRTRVEYNKKKRNIHEFTNIR